MNARDIRLRSDHDNLLATAKGSGGALTVESVRGRPPDEYVLVYHCRSVERLEGNRAIFRDRHQVEIKLPARYPAPSAPPVVKMLTPIFHPHVYKNLVVCMGSWQTSEYLDVFALRLAALLQYEKEYLDVRDPANEQAMDWAKQNRILFPTDTRTFRGDEPVQLRTPAMPGGFQPLMDLPGIDLVSSVDEDDDGIEWTDF